MNEAVHSLRGILDQWCSLGNIPEVDWRKMRSLEFQETLRTRDTLVKQLDSAGCTLCGDFDDHVSMVKVYHFEIEQRPCPLFSI